MEDKLATKDVPLIAEILATHSSKWRLIGGQLGFTQAELDTIFAKVPLNDHPYSCLSTMLEEWSQWPVGEHIYGASLCALQKSLRSKTVRLGAVADELSKTFAALSNAHVDKYIPTASPGSRLEVAVNSKFSFPSIVLKNLSTAQRSQLEARLYGESNDMGFKFRALFSSTFKSLKQRNVPVLHVVQELAGLSHIQPVYSDSELPAFRKQYSALRKATSIDDIMWVVLDYCSFFNIQILECIIESLGSDEDKRMLQTYQDTFFEYAKRKVYDMPSEVCPVSDNCQALVYVTLDDSYNDCTLNQLRLFHSKLCSILQVSKTVLQLCFIKSGSLKLTFQVPSFVKSPTLPLTSDQESSLMNLGVISFSYTFVYQFSEQEQKQEQSDASIERDQADQLLPLLAVHVITESTDSETETEAATVTSKKSVKTDELVVPVAKSTGTEKDGFADELNIKELTRHDITAIRPIHTKGDDDDDADSAFGTVTSVFSELTQTRVPTEFSQDIVDRDLEDPFLDMEQEANTQTSSDNHDSLHELLKASYKGELDKVRHFVEKEGLNPLQRDEYGNNALHYAAEHGQLPILRYLIDDRGCNAGCLGQGGATTLHYAALGGHLNVVEYLVKEKQVDFLNQDDKLGQSPLHDACQGGNLDVVKYLINKMQNFLPIPDIMLDKTNNETIPLHVACTWGRLPVVEHLISIMKTHMTVKEIANITNNNGNTPLHLATLYNHFELMQYLITHLKSDPHISTFQLGRTPLHNASQNGNTDIVRYLVDDQKCNPSPNDKKNATPLHLAAMNGHMDVVKYFTIEKQCPPSPRNSYDNTPIHNAALMGHFKLVEFFITELKCDPNIRGQYGRTPLHCAAYGGHQKVVEYLIEEIKCDPSIVDANDGTLLHLASMNGHLSTLKYLCLNLQADPMCTDRFGNIPLHNAARGGHLNVVKFFVETLHCPPDVAGPHNRTPLDEAAIKGHHHVVEYLKTIL